MIGLKGLQYWTSRKIGNEMVGRRDRHSGTGPTKMGVGEVVFLDVPGSTVYYGKVLVCASWDSPLGGTLENHPHHFFSFLASSIEILVSLLFTAINLYSSSSFLSRVLVVPVSD